MLNFDPNDFRYPSRRSVTYGAGGMVCTSTPLAANVGLSVLEAGGNAIDAAIATAAALTVLEPTSNGLGSDAFALVWKDGELHGLNASGHCPSALTPEIVKSAGHEAVPMKGWLPVMVPGAVGGWAELSKRFGSISLEQTLRGAANYASNGYPLSPIVARNWQRAVKAQKELSGAEYAPWLDLFAPGGVAPSAGQIWRSAEMASTLRSIGSTNGDSFYRGELMERTIAFSKQTGGYLSESDYTSYAPEWVTPITTKYRGYDVFEMPPNGHGITVLMALNILEGLDLGSYRDDAQCWHKMIEAIKLAFIDAKHYVSDPRTMRTKVEDMLSAAYADKRRSLICDSAINPQVGDPSCGDTVYLATADKYGNMVSYIQSNYGGFGSGIVVPNTGISLQNRGANFSLDPNSDNCLAGGKKAYHTIIPGFLAKDGHAIGPFGVMGGFMQPQGHVQVLVNAIDFGLNPQQCLDAPRFQWTGDKRIEIEYTAPIELIAKLRSMGHEVSIMTELGGFGRGQIIWRDEHGVLCGATEPRCDGAVAVF